MKRLLLALAALLVVGAAGAAGFWYYLEQRLVAFASTKYGGATARLVEIKAGTNPRKLAEQLAREGIVSDGELLYAWLRHEKLGPKLRAGEYFFEGPLTPAEVIEKIVRGEVKQYRVTVPEGLRVDEIIPLLAGSELRLSAEKLAELTRNATLARRLGIPADGFEGFLFPDTYSFPRGATEEAVLRKMVERALEELEAAPRKAGISLTPLQAMTLASIVEKETGAVEERPRIACVFHNRLRLDMKLQTDPTVLYAKALRTGTFSKNITRADLTAEHPYNTYAVKGLPPGPIASPGAAAIRAALSPIDCSDLFFVSKNDGTHVFCPDLQCHEANVRTWQVEYFRNRKSR